MNAVKIIEEIKALPEKEQAEVLCFLEEMKRQHPVKEMDDAAFEAAAEHVFKKHDGLLRKLAQ